MTSTTPQSVIEILAIRAQEQEAEDRERLSGRLPMVGVPPAVMSRLKDEATRRTRAGAYCSVTRLVAEMLLAQLEILEKL